MRMSVHDGTLSDALPTPITGSGSMTHLRLLAVAALFGLSTAASASTFYTISDAVSESVGSISDGTSGTSGSFSEDKVVLAARDDAASFVARSEEHTSELPSLMRNSLAVFRLK